MFGKFLGNKTLMGREVKEFLKKSFLARYMTKTGLSRDQVLAKFMSEKVGWNGVIGEIFEETVNQPLSNWISGEDIFSGMDDRFFGELAISMGGTGAVFAGLGVGANLIRGRRTGGYSIDDGKNTKTYTKKRFLEEIKRLEKENYLQDSKYQ